LPDFSSTIIGLPASSLFLLGEGTTKMDGKSIEVLDYSWLKQISDTG
jgi:hypothetical protein